MLGLLWLRTLLQVQLVVLSYHLVRFHYMIVWAMAGEIVLLP
jgi:hypothetical protein